MTKRNNRQGQRKSEPDAKVEGKPEEAAALTPELRERYIRNLEKAQQELGTKFSVKWQPDELEDVLKTVGFREDRGERRSGGNVKTMIHPSGVTCLVASSNRTKVMQARQGADKTGYRSVSDALAQAMEWVERTDRSTDTGERTPTSHRNKYETSRNDRSNSHSRR